MNNMKKLLAMLLCMVLLITSFSACKKSDGTNNNATNSNEDTTNVSPTEGGEELVEIDFSEPVEYTYWLYSDPNDYYSSYSENPVVTYLNKKFNMTLTFEQPATGTETDSLNLMFGTGEYTDIIDSLYYRGSISQLYEDGVIINIADYLDYMPNFKKRLEADELLRKNIFDDQGKILKIPRFNDVANYMWGGLVYRRDILETMTGGNVQFPSSNDYPTTIEDWDYMLPLMKQYFEASGMADYGVFILPANGYFISSNLVNSFGTAPSYYLKDGTVRFGPVEDGFYNYLKKMNEWYEAGYIYKDFASRTNDLFYLPNTSLTYGGGAGIWFGLNNQLGSSLSMPDYGLNVDVQGIPDPIDTANGLTAAPNHMFNTAIEFDGGVMISATCENVERLLTTLDFLFTEEGSYLNGYGLDKEHGSAENEIYVKNGLADGAYSISEDGVFTFSKEFTFMGGSIDQNAMRGLRLPGLNSELHNREASKPEQVVASEKWLLYQEGFTKLPRTLTKTSEEDSISTTNDANINDYVNTMVLNFILGSEELNDKSWAVFKAQIEDFGLQENLAIAQASYDRFLAR